MKKEKIITAVVLLIVFVVVGFLLVKFSSSIKGTTETGTVKAVEELPCYGYILEGFPVKGDIHYLYHHSLSRTLVYFAGEADNVAVERFSIENGWGGSCAYNLGDGDIWEEFPKGYQPESHFKFPDSQENTIHFPRTEEPMSISMLFVTSENRFIVKILSINRN